MRQVEPFLHLGRVVATLWVDLVTFLGSSLRSRTAQAAESLFLRKYLALCYASGFSSAPVVFGGIPPPRKG